MLLRLLYLGRERRDLRRLLDLRRGTVLRSRTSRRRLLFSDPFERLPTLHLMTLAESTAPVGTLCGLWMNPARYFLQFYN